MIRDLGVVKPGATLYLPFHTFDSNDPSASVTLTGLAVTDIEIYKDGGTTQRASDSGYALLDTDGIDFDGITGIHGISIDLSDNTTAGFYAAGSQYWIVISSVTVDGATINFVLATFSIGYPDAILNTTIATLASQTSFTLTAGPADDDALNGCVLLSHDVASAVQVESAVVSNYAGATKTVTLADNPGIFTKAVTDNVSFFMPANARWFGQVTQQGDGTTLTEAGGDGDHLTEAGGDGDHLTAIDLPNQTMDITGSLSGSVGSVTGAVGSVTGAVGSVAGGINTTAGTLTTLDGLDTAQDTQHDSTRSDIAVVDGNVDTLLTRITSTLFAGITSLAEWIGLLAGKQVGDATALTELKATGAGSGTFDESTDSLEAFRDHVGDGTNLTESGGTGDQLTAITGVIATAQADLDILTGADGVNLLSATQASIDAIETDTGTTLETHLTDIKGGTFSGATDSLEAIRDRGDAAWTTGAGTGLTPLASGTAQGGTASTIQLAAGEAFGDNILNGSVVLVHTGTGAGQSRVITGYTGATDTATVTPNWTTNPSSDSEYEVWPGSANIAAVSNVAEDLPTATNMQTIDDNVDAVLLDTGEIGTAGAGLTNINLPDQTMDITGNLSGSVGSVTGHTAQTGDTYALASGASGFAAIKTDTGDLVTRITATLFAGITSLAEWIGLLGGKQAGDATALTEIKATGAGSGTYDPTTDSNEALRDTAPMGTAMRGTDSAATATNLATAQADLDIITGADGVNLLSATQASIDAIETDTNELQGDWVNGGRLDLILDARARQTTANSIETDTQDIQSRLPAALTGGGNIKADTLAISGSTEAADRLEATAETIALGVCDTGGSTTSIVTSSIDPAVSVTDQLKGKIVTFSEDTTTAALRSQSTDITASTSGGVLTVTALTNAPASGDTFAVT